MKSESLKRIALVRLDALGDSLLTTPALCLLRQQLPECRLLGVTHPIGTPIFQPLCDEVHEVTPTTPWQDIGRRLQEFGSQAVLCFSEKRRAALASWSSRAPLRIGFDPGRSQPLKWLANRLFFQRTFAFSHQPQRDPGLHEVERYVELVRLLLPQLSTDIPPLQLQPEASHYRAVAAYAEGPKLGVQLTPKWCRFGVEVEHLRDWLGQLEQPWLAIAGPAEAGWARTHFPEVPLYTSGDLLEYAALLEQLKVLLTIDTGAAHVAAARQVPVVDVFPEKHHQHCVRRWAPWRCPHRIVLIRSPLCNIGAELRGAVASLWNASK